MLSFFPRGVLDEILNLIEPVSEGFPSYYYNITVKRHARSVGLRNFAGYMLLYYQQLVVLGRTGSPA